MSNFLKAIGADKVPRPLPANMSVAEKCDYSRKELQDIFNKNSAPKSDVWARAIKDSERMLNKKNFIIAKTGKAKPRKGLKMKAASRLTVAQRLKELESFLTPELKQKINNMHNIEGDILTLNDRAQAIQESLTPTEKLKEMQDQCVKMVRRVNKAHGDLFRAKSEQEGVNEMFDKQIEDNRELAKKFIEDFGSKHNFLVKKLAGNPWLRLGGWFSWERAFWILIGSQAVVLIAGLITKVVG